MPIRVDNDLPAREVLESENIFMMGEERADTQQIRPLEIVILNLMPLKQDYEIQLLRALSNTPLQVNVTCMNVSSHVSAISINFILLLKPYEICTLTD